MDPRIHLEMERAFSSQLRVRRWSVDEGPPVQPRPSSHAGIELAWVDRGEVTYRIGTRVLELKPGSVVIVPAGVEHANGFRASMIGGSLQLGEDLVHQVGDAMGPAFTRCMLEPGLILDGARLAKLGALIAEEARDQAAGMALSVDALAEAVAVGLWRHAGAPAPGTARPDGRIRAAIERIHAQHASPLSVEDLASTAGMSRFHFSRAFREATGLSPYQYLLRTRLDAAAALLRRGHHSVTEAALDAGFTDLSRFSRMFKQHLGVSPSALTRPRPAAPPRGLHH